MKDNRRILQWKSTFNGLHYTCGEDGYYYPDITLPGEKYEIGRFGRMHHEYLKKNKRALYTQLLTSGKLNEYLHNIDTQAQEMYELLMKQYVKKQGITEQLKVENQMEWVGRMNNIKACAEETVMNELIYQ